MAGPVAWRAQRARQHQHCDAAILFTILYLYSVLHSAVKPRLSYTGVMRLISGLALVATLLAAPVAAERLPRTVVPEHYDLAFTIDLAREQFSGQETIRVNVVQPTSRIILHALDLTLQDVTVASAGISQRAMVIFDRTNETAAFELPQRLASGPAEIRLRFSGTLNERLRGLYL